MTHRLAVSELCFSYRGSESNVLDNVNWCFANGALTSVTGPSGRGKSTLLFILGQLLRPTHGSVTWDGHDLTRWGDCEASRFRAETVGFVFQDAALDPRRSTLENVLEGCAYSSLDRREATRRAKDLTSQFGVDHRAKARPGQISGGQAQRVALCRALIHRPALILADEPTGNLDAASSALVLDGLDHAAELGATVVVATHDPEVVRRCAHALLLECA